MIKKSYTLNVSIILGVSVVLMLFIFVLVAHHRGISERVRQDRSELLGAGSSVADSVPSAEKPVEKAAAVPTPSGR